MTDGRTRLNSTVEKRKMNKTEREREREKEREREREREMRECVTERKKEGERDRERESGAEGVVGGGIEGKRRGRALYLA